MSSHSHSRIIAGIKEIKEMLEKIQHGNDLECILCELEHPRGHDLPQEESPSEPLNSLEEIKQELMAIKCKLEYLSICKEQQAGDCHTDEESVNWDHGLTTGPVIRCDGVKDLYVEILNNLDHPRTIRILLFDLRQWPKQLIDNRVVTLCGNSAVSESFDIGPIGLDLLKFEVQVEFLSGSKKGIYVFVAGTCDRNGLTLVQSNVFRHEQLSPIDT